MFDHWRKNVSNNDDYFVDESLCSTEYNKIKFVLKIESNFSTDTIYQSMMSSKKSLPRTFLFCMGLVRLKTTRIFPLNTKTLGNNYLGSACETQ